MTDFHALHRPGDPLLLPNAWDVASAYALAGAGFAAIGTTSLGVAAAHGFPDGQGHGKIQTLDLVRRLSGLKIPLTVDIEGGFGGSPAEITELAADLHAAGAAGINIEDGRPDGTLAPVAEQAELIAAIKAGVPGLFVNARTDTHWLTATTPDDGEGFAGGTEAEWLLAAALDRGRAYLEAGADGIFVPAVSEDDDIQMLAATLDAPLNILLLPGMTVARLAALGVARISTGSLLFRAALAAAVATARAVADGTPAPADLPTYAEANTLAPQPQ